jgi:hypothetical protein
MIYLDPSLLYMPVDVFEASFLSHISRTYFHSWCFTWAVCHHLTSFERNPTQLSIFGFQQIFQVCKFHLHNIAWTKCRCTSNTNKVNEWMNFCFVCLQCNHTIVPKLQHAMCIYWSLDTYFLWNLIAVHIKDFDSFHPLIG